MVRVWKQCSTILLALLVLPTMAYAQAAITGVVRDANGKVVDGVSVEVASPVLIERVRDTVTSNAGTYRITDLPAGTYSVKFSADGFSTLDREGVELSGSFVASVNANLKLGSREEVVTVTSDSPIVDVQSAKGEQTLSKDAVGATPTSGTLAGVQALIPGMSYAADAGGISGGSGGNTLPTHGGRANDAKTEGDGLNMGWAGAGANGALNNIPGAKEVVITTSGGNAEAETSGTVMNVISRDGGNTFSGTMIASGATSSFQGSNFTPALQAAGLKANSHLVNVYDFNPMGGGKLIKDKVWYYLTFRQFGATNTVPGMFINENAGNPAKQFTYPVQFDLSQQATADNLNRNGIAHVTWQATPRNKFRFHWSEQYVTSNTKGGGSGTQTIEATDRTIFQPSHVQQVTWESPITSHLLAQAGFGTYLSTYRFAPRVDGTFNPDMFRVVEQAGAIPGLAYNQPIQFTRSSIGTREWRASLAYINGAHDMKFGYQGGFDDPDQLYYYYNSLIAYRFKNGVPNQLTESGVYPNNIKYVRNLLPANFYGEDHWTHNRLTVQGGIRFDHITTSYPLSVVLPTAIIPSGITYPSRSTPGVDWKNITPRVGGAYDLFGNGKTAIKANLGKYMEAFSATNTDLDLNPLIRNTVSTTRSWTDTNQDFVPQCNLANPLANGECGPVADNKIGTAAFTRSYDPAFINGWGTAPYNWEFDASVQQQVLPRLSVTVDFDRRWFGNQYVVANEIGGLTGDGVSNAANYSPFSIQAPFDPRLPGGGGQTIGGLYHLNPNLVGQVNEVAQSSTNFAKEVENWQGVDFIVKGQLAKSLTVQAGTDTGRRHADDCAVRALIPELGAGANGQANASIAGSTTNVNNITTAGMFQSVVNPYCNITEPYLTQFRGLATYTVPRVLVQLSATFQSNPGPPEAALYVVPNAAVVPSLGRSLSGGAPSVTVNLVTPGSLYGARINQIDLRMAKVLRFNKTRTRIGVDIYNLLNAGTALSVNNNFVPGGAWLTPLTVMSARYVKISASFDW